MINKDVTVHPYEAALRRARNAEQRERELLEIHNNDQKELDRLKREVSELRADRQRLEVRNRSLIKVHRTREEMNVNESAAAQAKAEERIENLSRELHRWQTGTQIEGDYVTHWVKRSEFEAVAKRRDELARQVKGLVELGDSLRKELGEKEVVFEELEKRNDHLVKELSKSEHLRVGQLEDKGKRILALQGKLYRARSDRDQFKSIAEDTKLTNKNLFEERERLNKRIDELEGISNGLRKERDRLLKELAEQKNDALNEYYVDIERVAKLESALKAENERLREDRDRLRKHLKETNAKRANYKREIRRLQDALLRQRGQHRWVEIERLEQRVQALEENPQESVRRVHVRYPTGRVATETVERKASNVDVERAESKLQELEWRIVHNAARVSRENKPRWSHVSDVTAHGSTVSADMCRHHGVDPDELIGGDDGDE